jgi:PAS domain-containing protein
MSNLDLMKAFFDGTDAFLYAKDADGRFVLMNKAGALALGLSEAECAYDVIPEKEADRDTQLDRQVAESGKPVSTKSLVSLPDGQRTLLDHKFPISIPDHPGAVAGIVIDVTDDS